MKKESLAPVSGGKALFVLYRELKELKKLSLTAFAKELKTNVLPVRACQFSFRGMK